MPKKLQFHSLCAGRIHHHITHSDVHTFFYYMPNWCFVTERAFSCAVIFQLLSVSLAFIIQYGINKLHFPKAWLCNLPDLRNPRTRGSTCEECECVFCFFNVLVNGHLGWNTVREFLLIKKQTNKQTSEMIQRHDSTSYALTLAILTLLINITKNVNWTK